MERNIRTSKIIIAIFLAILILEIYASLTGNKMLVFITKPLLMPILMLLVFKKHSSNKLLYGGLFFSFLGDVFLMFNNYFIAGLLAFLVAQVCYIFLFKPQFKFSAIIILLFGISTFLYLGYIFSGIQADMQIPVMAYSVIITIMGIMAGSRQTISKLSYWYVLIGAILFIISDSLIAFDKFYSPIPMPSLLVMSTYGVAQLLIVLGFTKEPNIN